MTANVSQNLIVMVDNVSSNKIEDKSKYESKMNDNG